MSNEGRINLSSWVMYCKEQVGTNGSGFGQGRDVCNNLCCYVNLIIKQRNRSHLGLKRLINNS
jgi:hypothetical protein